LNLLQMKAVRIFIMLLTISTIPAPNPELSRVRMFYLGNQMSTKTVFTRTRPLVSCLSSCPTSPLLWDHVEASLAVAVPTVTFVCLMLEALVDLAWETNITKTKTLNQSRVSISIKGKWEAVASRTLTRVSTSLTIKGSRDRSARATRS